MPNIYLSNFELLSSQGDLSDTLKAIKNNDITISKKHIVTDIQSVDAPYFLLKDEIKEDKDEIYQALENITSKIISGLEAKDLPSTALIIGTALADMYIIESIADSVYENEKKPYKSEKTSIDTYAKKLSKKFGLNDFTMTINTACTSSANGILEGSNLIKAGIVDSVIVLGIEIYSPMMSSGFSAMNLLSLNKQRPFEDSRDGLVLGEALAGIVLSKEKSKHELLGGYSNCNASSITGVSESGEEYIEVMKKALINSQTCAKSLSAIKTHATSTHASDLSEMNAMDDMFEKKPTLCALKPYVGHTIGACGTLELAIFLSCIDDGFIPKLPSKRKNTQCENGIFLLNYFGFGGNNTSLIVQSGQS
ncbi:MAG: beta-ketoacyl synthase N-terminal-like domain-containing protein [Thiovulaceae bacterium]|nr:beta-ketoacyl synthase N-terminal-like domain-containing protein [Sulfurimonadaceae bacterium]MCW9026333.1 beta-ketoacyl synthase N-terminal-like domain-containing protein [Sulfurimonadaceae bacterium]